MILGAARLYHFGFVRVVLIPVFCVLAGRGVGSWPHIRSAAGVCIGTRPGEIVGATGRRDDRVAAIEQPCRKRIGFPFSRMACGAQKVATFAAADRTERNDRADWRARDGGPVRRRLFLRAR